MEGRSRLRLTLALVVGILAVAAFGILRTRGGGQQAEEDEPLPGPTATTVVRGTLTAGFDLSVPPFAFRSGETATGFDVELLEEAARRLGLDVRIVEGEIAELLERLSTGELDVVGGGVPATEATEQWGDVTQPTFVVRQALVTDPEARPDIEEVQDLAPGDRVGVAEGSAGETWAQGNLPPRAVEVLAYPDAGEAIAAAARAEIAAAMVDELAAQGASFDVGGLRVAQTFSIGQHLGFAVDQSNPGLLDALNQVLADVVEDGTYDEVYGRYAGSLPPGGRVTETVEPIDLPG